jgi:hypothetical protein
MPVMVNYSTASGRHEKAFDGQDLAVLQRIEGAEIPYWYPATSVPDGFNTQQPRRSHGVTHVHHFYTKRNLWVLSAVYSRLVKVADSRLRHHLLLWFTSQLINMSRMNRFRRVSFPYNPLSGTLYISSTTSEAEVITAYRNKLSRLLAAEEQKLRVPAWSTMIQAQSATSLPFVPDCSIDYIFTDPPFGGNLMYSELNFISESWLRVFTSNRKEAIVNAVQGKDLGSYRELMTRCFGEMYRVLKPGRWITVEFHNSSASIWNAIQEALARAGFLVAQVTVLDKQQGSFKQVTSPGSVENDLIINAYRPRAGFSQRFISTAGQGLEADFVRQHLQQLPLAANIERSKEMLYSKYLAYYVQHGFQVAYNGYQFYRALGQWGLVERDGYWFAGEAQANEYEKRKAGAFSPGGKGKSGASQAQAVLFISDEHSARQWLWHFLAIPQTYNDIYTAYVKALQTSEDELPELRAMLEEGFIQSNGDWRRPDAVSQAELEKRRQERLLRQFEEYLAAARAGQRVPEVRKEAVVAGFAEAYRAARYDDILAVGRKLPKRLVEEDPVIFDFIDIAETKMES